MSATPRRRSARLAGASSVKSKATAPNLSSVSEYVDVPEEVPEQLPQKRRDVAPSSPPPAPSTPASSAMKPPHDEMHPSKAHQTMGQPSSALRLGFSDIKPVNKDGSRIGLPGTPSKVGVPSASFTFRVSEDDPDGHLSGDAQRLMEELREQAARIKADLVAQREADGAGADGLDRKIAKPKGKTSRFSAAHMAEFKKMDSIENHASAWRAQNGRFTPVVSLKRTPSKANLETTPTSQTKSGLKRSPSKANLDVTPTSQTQPGLHRSASKPDLQPATPSTPRLKPSLKRKSEIANLDEIQQSPSPKKGAAPSSLMKPRIFASVEQPEIREQPRAVSKRFKQRPEDDASTARPDSRDGTSIPRPKSSGTGSGRAAPSGLARLISPTKASLAHTAPQDKPAISLTKKPSISDFGKTLKKVTSQQNLQSPAKPGPGPADFGKTLKKVASQHALNSAANPAPGPADFGKTLKKVASQHALNSAANPGTATPRARVISPGRFEKVKSILRGHRTVSGNVQTAIPQPSTSQTPAPPQIERTLASVPLTTPRRKVTKHVAFTPEVTRISVEEGSPSPLKTSLKPKPMHALEEEEDQYPTLDAILAKSQSGDVVYPDLSGFRPLPEPPAKQDEPKQDEPKQDEPKPAEVPGTFTFRSDRTIEFGGASETGFGGSPGQSSIRQVRKSIKPAAEMPGSFPNPASPSIHSNKENKAPSMTKMLFGAPHGMPNKRRHRASWDEEEAEEQEAERATKKRKSQHVPEGDALLAPRLVGATPQSNAKKIQTGRSVSGVPGSVSPTKKRGIISMSRLNMLARPKNRG